MEWLSDYALFLAQTLTVVLAGLVLISAAVAAVRAGRPPDQQDRKLSVRRLNEQYERTALTMQSAMLSGKAARAERKAFRKRWKNHGQHERERLFVIDFDGDLQASAVHGLREEVTAILTVAAAGDEVLVRLDSGGGVVPGYGLAAAQLARLRARELKLTVAVDRVAASGGYMMAAVADRILAAPFAVVGSIGVVAQLPNFHRLLRKHDIDFEQFTAGEYKRTVTLFGENTDQGRGKLQQEIEEAHALFKDFVHEHRPQLDLDRVATGEYWYGRAALALKLVDVLSTSDDYLLNAVERADIYLVSSTRRQRGLRDWLGLPAGTARDGLPPVSHR